MFEYIELQNVSGEEIALLGCRFTDGVDYNFDSNAFNLLGAGQHILVVRDRAAFAYRYGEQAASQVTGEFVDGTGLSNDGEAIAIQGLDGLIREFTYNDKLPWPESADGDGFSLVLRSPETNPDHNVAENWRASRLEGGSPGEKETSGQSFLEWAALNGGVAPESDSDQDGRSALLEYAMGTDPNLSLIHISEPTRPY